MKNIVKNNIKISKTLKSCSLYFEKRRKTTRNIIAGNPGKKYVITLCIKKKAPRAIVIILLMLIFDFKVNLSEFLVDIINKAIDNRNEKIAKLLKKNIYIPRKIRIETFPVPKLELKM